MSIMQDMWPIYFLVLSYTDETVEFFLVRQKHVYYGFYGQGKSRKTQRVRESHHGKSIMVQKLTKVQKIFELLYADCEQQFKIFLLASPQIICTSTFTFVLLLLFVV